MTFVARFRTRSSGRALALLTALALVAGALLSLFAASAAGETESDPNAVTRAQPPTANETPKEKPTSSEGPNPAQAPPAETVPPAEQVPPAKEPTTDGVTVTTALAGSTPAEETPEAPAEAITPQQVPTPIPLTVYPVGGAFMPGEPGVLLYHVNVPDPVVPLKAVVQLDPNLTFVGASENWGCQADGQILTCTRDPEPVDPAETSAGGCFFLPGDVEYPCAGGSHLGILAVAGDCAAGAPEGPGIPQLLSTIELSAPGFVTAKRSDRSVCGAQQSRPVDPGSVPIGCLPEQLCVRLSGTEEQDAAAFMPLNPGVVIFDVINFTDSSLIPTATITLPAPLRFLGSASPNWSCTVTSDGPPQVVSCTRNEPLPPQPGESNPQGLPNSSLLAIGALAEDQCASMPSETVVFLEIGVTVTAPGINPFGTSFFVHCGGEQSRQFPIPGRDGGGSGDGGGGGGGGRVVVVPVSTPATPAQLPTPAASPTRSSGQLPSTGAADIGGLVRLGFGLLVVGGGLVAVARRSRGAVFGSARQSV
jgi:hypothetical protein